MKTLFCTLLALSCLAAPSLALQTTPGSAVLRLASSPPAPLDSLLAEPTTPLTYVPDAGDVIVMEVESLPSTSRWLEETALSGFGGDSYFRWDGPNLFSSPGSDTLSYTFEIKRSDTYLIRVHVRHDDPDPSEENDCWARLSTDNWEKLFHNNGPGGVGSWSFNPRYESTSNFPQYSLAPGTYTFQISGRSHNFKIDRVHVLPLSTWFAQLGDAQSDVQRSRPVIGQALSVEIDDPTNSAGLTPGVAQTAWYGGVPGAGYPNGVSTNFGELFLVGPGGANRIGGFQTWNGPGQANLHSAILPNDISLVGQTFITQGLIFQPGKLVLTDGLELNVGDF